MSEATRRAHRNRMAREQERLYREQLAEQRALDGESRAALAAAADAGDHPGHEQHSERCRRCNLWHGAYDACPTGEIPGERAG